MIKRSRVRLPAMCCRVSTWMWAGKPSRYVLCNQSPRSTQPSICLAGVMAVCVHWCQVADTLCAPVWQVTPRYSEMTCSGELYRLTGKGVDERPKF